MPASYPSNLKSWSPAAKIDFTDYVIADDVNSIRDEVIAIESALGTSPATSAWGAGTFDSTTPTWANLKTRINNIEYGLKNVYDKVGGANTLSAASISGTTSQFNAALTDNDFATLAGTEVLSNKILLSPEERCVVSATAATGTINFDTITQGVLYYTSNAAANFTLNIRGNSGTTLNSLLAVGDSITVTFLNTNGATAYYPTAYQIDGSAVTPKWAGGIAPASGNASSIDAYTLTIIKTASTPTYTIFASQSRYV